MILGLFAFMFVLGWIFPEACPEIKIWNRWFIWEVVSGNTGQGVGMWEEVGKGWGVKPDTILGDWSLDLSSAGELWETPQNISLRVIPSEEREKSWDIYPPTQPLVDWLGYSWHIKSLSLLTCPVNGPRGALRYRVTRACCPMSP